MKRFLVSGLFMLILSCQDSKMDIEYSLPTPEGLIHWDILKVEGEKSVKVKDTLRLDVYCPRSSTCDYIAYLLPDKYGSRILVKAFGNSLQNTACLWYALPQVVQYKFVSDKSGVFTLGFIKGDGTIINYIVHVEQ